jgi:hypothetical protein
MKTASYIQFCNENSGRAYPLSEYATRIDDNGNTMSNDIIIDLGILLPVNYTGLRVSSVAVSDSILSVAISADAGGLLTATLARTGVRPYTAYPLDSLVDDVSGWVVFGGYKGVRRYYQFSTEAQSGIELRAVKVVPAPGVKRFHRVGNTPTLYATGIVDLEVSSAFIVEQDPDNTNNIIVRLSADAKSRFIEPCTRPASATNCCVPPLRSINNVPPNVDGEITLRFE